MNANRIRFKSNWLKWVQAVQKFGKKKPKKNKKMLDLRQSWRIKPLFLEKTGKIKKIFMSQFHVDSVTGTLRTRLGSTWIIRCDNESYPSHVTNSSFETTKKRKSFEINRTAVLRLQTVGCWTGLGSGFFFNEIVFHRRENLSISCYLSNYYCSRINWYFLLSLISLRSKFYFSFFLYMKIWRSCACILNS